MLGDYWVPNREFLVTQIEDNMIVTGLKNNYSVIIDATNLNPKTIARFEQLAIKFKVKIEFILIEVTPIVAYFRVILRKLNGGRFISYKVIKGFYNRHKK